jgi:tetratricopeptide (TPR) repeat protein
MNSRDDVLVRALAPTDIRAAMRISEAAGWNQTETDWHNLLRLAPDTCYGLKCDDSRRLILLGELYSGNGAFSDAIEPLRQAVKLDPESFDAWNSLGVSLFRLKRYQEALPPLRKAASLNPQFFSTLTLLASTLHALGDDAAALPVLERAHKLNPDDAQVTSRLEQLRLALRGK